MLPLILFSIAGCSFLIACSLLRADPSIKYVGISHSLLNQWVRHREDLIILDLRPRRGSIPSALRVSVRQVSQLLPWMPSKTTLVLCGQGEIDRYRTTIEAALVHVGINVVYVPDEAINSCRPNVFGNDPLTSLS